MTINSRSSTIPVCKAFRLQRSILRRPMDFGQEFETQSSAFYRPVFWMTLFADWCLWGPHPEGFHAFNIALHFLNGVLVFLLFRRWFVPLVALFAALSMADPAHSFRSGCMDISARTITGHGVYPACGPRKHQVRRTPQSVSPRVARLQFRRCVAEP